MSDLQISLLVIGAAVVGAVYLFNRVQERKLRRKLEQAFATAHDDVLLETVASPPAAGERIEPQLQPAEDPPGAAEETRAESGEPGHAPAAPSDAPVPAPAFDPAIEFIAQIDADAPISDALLGELLNKTAACGKPVRGIGFNADAGQWEDLAPEAGNRYGRLCLALQLVNRGGPVHPAQLAAFCDAVKGCAGKISAAVTLPDIQEALGVAAALDRFCAEVDIAIGINVVAPDAGVFSATKIRALAEAAGFKLEPGGIFHYRNDERQTLFTLDNHEPAPFIPEQMKSLTTSGITLLLDVPRVANGQKILDRMIETGKGFAHALGGRLVDDNRAELNEPGIVKIKRQLDAIYAEMEAHGIHAGSERALRLFS
ncbi:MAG TPA: cell division protein ZipA C-terminal FtsZ-binding domain-containing protein [Burkholderiales bacterium]|nr:cell division protein ZipA C-terminal FtsZ-binding domain-containing protein [Burkholderiales bacterium]